METVITNNRLKDLFAAKRDILSIYFTAGFPQLQSTADILLSLQNAGVDMVEVGIPFSDPVADGPVIQRSSQQALDNGISLELIFEQLRTVNDQIQIPIVLMGYFNPILQYGVEKFCQSCSETGVSAAIIPDLPLAVFKDQYEVAFGAAGLNFIPLISPQTSDARIKEIDGATEGFIYVVASNSITGAKGEISNLQEQYFKRIANLGLDSPLMIGFGISNNATYRKACQFAQGAIIGSAFINRLRESNDLENDIKTFVDEIKLENNDS